MIILTGDKGFIGSHLKSLIQKKYKGEKIVLVDKPKYDLVTGKNLAKIPGSPRLVFHLAAATDTAKRDQRCNDIGTKNLLKALKNLDSKTHFVYTSSLAVYSGRKNCDRPIDVTTPTSASNEYGVTKLRAEKMLIEAAQETGFKLTIIRLPTVWGDNPRQNSFLNFLKNLVKNDSIFAGLDWPGKTGLINVDDAAKYLLRIAAKPPKNYQIIPIAAENPTLKEIFKILYQAQNKKYREIKVPESVWVLAKFLKKYLKYFEFILPVALYNYFWRASIVVDSPLWCKVNVKGTRFMELSSRSQTS